MEEFLEAKHSFEVQNNSIKVKVMVIQLFDPLNLVVRSWNMGTHADYRKEAEFFLDQLLQNYA